MRPAMPRSLRGVARPEQVPRPFLVTQRAPCNQHPRVIDLRAGNVRRNAEVGRDRVQLLGRVVHSHERLDQRHRCRPRRQLGEVPLQDALTARLRGATRGTVMGRFDDAPVSRRRLLLAGLALGVPAIVNACSSGGGGDRGTRRPRATTGPSAGASPTSLAPTPACGDNAQATKAQTEGPFFETNSPEKSNFTSDVDKGTKIVLTGTVLTTACQPVQRALLDVWHADADGEYDNDGYRLRGHFFTDAEGAYRLETIVPGLYPGRTRHFHFKVQPRGGKLLTTQLYFPGEPRNEQDSIFNSELLMAVQDGAGGKDATFTFVV
jgi:Dioxygenase